MDDNAMSVMEPMGFLTKDQAMGMRDPSMSFTDLKIHDERFLDLTPDMVALAYHATAKMGQTGKPYRGSILAVFGRRDGKWKLLLSSHQPWPEKEEKAG